MGESQWSISTLQAVIMIQSWILGAAVFALIIQAKLKNDVVDEAKISNACLREREQAAREARHEMFNARAAYGEAVKQRDEAWEQLRMIREVLQPEEAAS